MGKPPGCKEEADHPQKVCAYDMSSVAVICRCTVYQATHLQGSAPLLLSP